jgi:hypothetical protein
MDDYQIEVQASTLSAEGFITDDYVPKWWSKSGSIQSEVDEAVVKKMRSSVKKLEPLKSYCLEWLNKGTDSTHLFYCLKEGEHLGSGAADMVSPFLKAFEVAEPISKEPENEDIPHAKSIDQLLPTQLLNTFAQIPNSTKALLNSLDEMASSQDLKPRRRAFSWSIRFCRESNAVCKELFPVVGKGLKDEDADNREIILRNYSVLPTPLPVELATNIVSRYLKRDAQSDSEDRDLKNISQSQDCNSMPQDIKTLLRASLSSESAITRFRALELLNACGLDSSLAPVLFDLISRETSPEAAKLELSTLSSITFNMPFDPKIAKLLPQALGSSSIDVIAEAISLLDRYVSKLAGSKDDKAALKDNCSLLPPVDEAIKNALGRDWPSKNEAHTRKVLADLRGYSYRIPFLCATIGRRAPIGPQQLPPR